MINNLTLMFSLLFFGLMLIFAAMVDNRYAIEDSTFPHQYIIQNQKKETKPKPELVKPKSEAERMAIIGDIWGIKGHQSEINSLAFLKGK